MLSADLPGKDRASFVAKDFWVALPFLFAAALFARIATFGNPILHIDEEFYLFVARRMLDGQTLYVDLWDRKPAGLFLLYMPSFLFGGNGVLTYQAMAFACVIATALLIIRLAQRAGWHRGALPAAILYILWLNFAEGAGGQAPVFYNLPMCAAAAFTLNAIETRRAASRHWWGLGTMALVGLAIQIKYSVLFEGIYFGVLLSFAEWRASRSIARVLAFGAVLIIVALLPTILVGLWFLAHGAFWDFFYANFISILLRGGEHDRALGRIGIVSAILAPLLIAAVVPLWMDLLGEKREPSLFVRGWLLAAIVGLALFGGWFDHYSLPVLVPATCCGASLFGSGKVGRWVAVGMIVISAILGQVVLRAKVKSRGSEAQISAIAQAIGRGSGCLYIFRGDPVLYSMTGRCTLSRYVFPGHLTLRRESSAIGTEPLAEIRRIVAARPDVIVMNSPYWTERPLARVTALQAMQGLYKKTADLPLGRNRVAVYHRTP